MGGKSTFIRSVALAVMLAHLGTFVPASSMTLTPVDRIFTRLGASDDLLSGKSTFYCEMEETKTILSSASNQSLIVMDELGRGTSTFDGEAIAVSVFEWLLKLNARLIFSTHYHMIQRRIADRDDAVLCMMGYYFRDERLIYLYKLQHGACP